MEVDINSSLERLSKDIEYTLKSPFFWDPIILALIIIALLITLNSISNYGT